MQPTPWDIRPKVIRQNDPPGARPIQNAIRNAYAPNPINKMTVEEQQSKTSINAWYYPVKSSDSDCDWSLVRVFRRLLPLDC